MFRKSSRMISVVLALLMVMGMLVPASVLATPSDIEGHWAQDVISQWLDGGLAGGYADGTFRPNDPITRAEFMAFVNRAFGFEDEVDVPFTDVPADAWYAPVIRQAMAAGYLEGYPDGTVRPNNPITRQEAAVIIMKVLELEADLAVLDQFMDADEIPEWSRSFISAVVKAGLMSGYPDGTFGSGNNITRAESVAALNNAREYADIDDDDDDDPVDEDPVAVTPAPPGARGSRTVDPDPIEVQQVTVTGTVYDDELNPLADAGVSKPQEGGGPPFAYSDEFGRFEFVIDQGTYEFTISKEGYKWVVLEDIVVDQDMDLGIIELESWGDPYTVTGRVYLPTRMHGTDFGTYEIYITTGPFFHPNGEGEVVSILYDYENNMGFEWPDGAEYFDYEMTAPAGTFYIYVVLNYQDDSDIVLEFGLYGANYDEGAPAEPNATVTAEGPNVFNVLAESFSTGIE